jgi:hypothetical protein
VEQDRSFSQQAETIREYCAHYNLILDKLYLDEARKTANPNKREALQTRSWEIMSGTGWVLGRKASRRRKSRADAV